MRPCIVRDSPDGVKEGMALNRALLVLMALGRTLAPAGQGITNFSGTWEIDRSRSKIVSSDRLIGGSLIQIIQHNEPQINVVRITRGPGGDTRLDLHLRTDGVPQVNTVDEQELSFQTRWKRDRLVSNIKPRESGDASWITETWSLSSDGNSLTVELNIRAEKGRIKERLVYRRTHYE